MKITVITVAYNAAATIADTLRSVAAQSHDDIEHLIIDGASTDDTAAIVRANAHPAMTFISEPDNGLYDAMNKGLARASGDLIGFLNADDFFCRTDAVARIAAAAAAHPGAAAVSGAVVIVDAERIEHATRAYPPTPFAPWMLRFGHMPPHPAFYTRRSAVEQLGLFDAKLGIGADFEWMLRFFHDAGLTAAPVHETLVTQRHGGVSTSGWGARRQLNAEAVASLRRHGIASAAPVVWSKYLLKVTQFAARPRDWPADDQVRWRPGQG